MPATKERITKQIRITVEIENRLEEIAQAWDIPFEDGWRVLVLERLLEFYVAGK